MSLTELNAAILQSAKIENQTIAYGLIIACCILGLWAVSLTFLILNLTHLPLWTIPFAILWQMFLYTGLFITTHDAMHGGVYPQNLKINHLIGTLAVFLYGLFSYEELLQKHHLHHRYPASDRDPDFHDGTHQSFIQWYLYFMGQYWSWRQLLGFSLIAMVNIKLTHIPNTTLILCWILPSILSSVQLFYFGTFLTHREPENGFQHPHRAKTNPLPTFWSFITCYHFGYHEEHHDFPQVPWWKLPAVHKLQTPS